MWGVAKGGEDLKMVSHSLPRLFRGWQGGKEFI
jgi:hypothetical protein